MSWKNPQVGGSQDPRSIGPTMLSAARARRARRIHDLRQGEVVVALMHRHPLGLLTALVWPSLLLLLWALSAIVLVPFLESLQVDPLLAVNAPPAWLAPLLLVAWLGMAIVSF